MPGPSSPPESAADWYLQGWRPHLILAILGLAMLLPGTAVLPLMDRDEPRFAQATWEMIERKEWFIPYFNDHYRFDKPVLSYWWMRIHDWVLGKTELASRLHSVVSAILSGLVILEIGRGLFGRRAGFWAGIGWLTCLQVLIHGRLCVADMPMLFGLTVAFWGMFRLLDAEAEPPAWGRWLWVLAGGLAFGFLAKGPIALAVPVGAFLLARFAFFREPIPWRRLQPVSLLLVVLVAVGLWGIPALIKTQGKFWEVGMGDNVVKRGMESFNGRVQVPVIYYLFTAGLSLLPWSAFYLVAWPRPVAPWKWQQREALLLGWALGPLIIFGFYATQLPHYIMPGFPAFFLLLFRKGPEALRDAGRWFWICVVGVGIPAALFAWGATQLPIPGEASAVGTILLLGALMFVFLSVWAVLARGQHWRWALAGVFVAGALTAGLTGVVRAHHPSPKILAAFREMGSQPRQLRSWRYEEPNLVFYVTHPVEFKKKPQEVDSTIRWAQDQPGRTLIFLVREWRLQDQVNSMGGGKGWATQPSQDHRAMIEASLGDKFETRTVTGVNVARASWVELVVCVPKGG